MNEENDHEVDTRIIGPESCISSAFHTRVPEYLQSYGDDEQVTYKVLKRRKH